MALAANDVPGGAIAMVASGHEIQAAGVGVRERGTSSAVDGDTLFQIASITKTLTALTALTLVDDGTIDLDAPFDTLVPFVNTTAPYDRPFTLAELLAHRAGYPVEIPDADYSNEALEGFFRANASVPLWSPPGLIFNYSNEGYSLAGLSLQLATSQPFPSIVESRVLTPLGITRSTLTIARVAADSNVSKGHTSGMPPLGPNDSYYGAPWYGPMGGAWMSARDLATVARMLIHHGTGVISSASYDRMVAAPPHADPQSYYGLGLEVEHDGDKTVLSHSGSVGGFGLYMQVVPEAGFAIVTLVNSDAYFPEEVHDWALSELAAVPPPEYGSWDPSLRAPR